MGDFCTENICFLKRSDVVDINKTSKASKTKPGNNILLKILFIIYIIKIILRKMR